MEQASIAVIGTGDWGRNLVRNLHKLSKLTAVCDINHIIAEQIALKYQVKNLTWQQILANKEINAVVIAKDQCHYQFTKEALIANKHVFVEKPLAHTFKHAKELCNIANQVNKKIMVGHLLRYHPAFVELQKLCKEQILGKIRYVYSNRLSFGKVMKAEDVLWNFVPHDISMILALMGKPKSINSYANYFLVNNIADQIIIKLNFSKEQKSHVFASWLHPIKERKFVVIGSKAMAVFDDTLELCKKLCVYQYTVDLDQFNQPVLKNLQPEFINLKNTEEPLFQEMNHFVNCIEQNLTPITDGQEALAVLRIIEKASKQLQIKQKACAD